jgi:hypothetical protein
MSLQNSTTVETIDAASRQYVIYSTPFIILIGLTGHTINLLVFTSLKLFRCNQSIFYLIVDTIINSIQLLIPLLSRCLVTGYAIEVLKSSSLFCKIRQTTAFICTLLSFNIICFAALNQYIVTHHRLYVRQISTLAQAHRLTLTAVIIWILHGIPCFILLDVTTKAGCNVVQTAYVAYVKFGYYLVLTGLLPIVVSAVFATLAYLNVRRLVQRSLAIGRRKLDRQLTAMTILRVTILVSFTLPFVIFRIYLYSVDMSSNTPIANAIIQLIDTVMVSMFYLHCSVNSKCHQRNQLSFFLSFPEFLLRILLVIGTIPSTSEAGSPEKISITVL